RNRTSAGRTGRVLAEYERITFEKEGLTLPGRPPAELVCPGHPLLDTTIALILERHRDLLRQGAVLVDPQDPGTTPRALFYLEHVMQDARPDRSGARGVVSQRLQFVEGRIDGGIRDPGSGIGETGDEGRGTGDADRGMEGARAEEGARLVELRSAGY